MFLNRYANWLRYKLNIRNRIIGLRLTTTWKCDSRCITCSIWQDPNAGKDDLTTQEIDSFSKSKYLKKVQYITLSGGEPTLRKDLPEVVSVLHGNIPKATFALTTHGMHPDIEEKMFRTILKENSKIDFRLVGISLNGPPEVHDKTRGVEGSWNKAIETYERLKDLVHCEFSFTFCRENVDYFDWVQNFAKKNGTKAYICWTVMNERFKVSDKDLVFWKSGMEKVLRKYVEDTLGTSKTLLSKILSLPTMSSGITRSCLYDNIVNRRVMPCFGGSQIVHIAPNGDVYPCNFKLTEDRILGNLRKRSFNEIWRPLPKKILGEIKRGDCMYPNGLCGDSDIYPSICNSPSFVLKWYMKKILTNKPLIDLDKNEKQSI